MQSKKIFYTLLIGGIVISIYGIAGNFLNQAYDINGNAENTAYNIEGDVVFPDDITIPIPSGDLIASEIIALPDLYQTGKGFTCTGLTFDASTNTFLIGDIGELQPGGTKSGGSNIVRLSNDFTEVVEVIPIAVETVQGVSLDTKRNCLWIAGSDEGKIFQVSLNGTIISSFTVSRPTGVVYSETDDTLWVLTYTNKIIHYTVLGSVIESYDFAYLETLDQCFLDEYRGLLYITAGTNYSGRNNIYCFNINTHEQYIACTVDSYSVEGIWLGNTNKMIILNDGYYHSAIVSVNQANIYIIN